MYAPRHARRRARRAGLAAAPVLAGAVLAGTLALPSGGADAATMTAYQREQAAMNWAITQRGKPYIWGGTGPYGYDCSGLVYAAFRRAGLTLPRTTYAMVWSWHLVRTWHPVRGNLAFWGPVGAPYHVEWVTAWPHTSFGEHHSGTVAGWESWLYSPPSAFYAVR